MIPSHWANLDGWYFRGRQVPVGSSRRRGIDSLGGQLRERGSPGIRDPGPAHPILGRKHLLIINGLHQIALLEATKHLDVPDPHAIVWPAKVGKAVIVERAIAASAVDMLMRSTMALLHLWARQLDSLVHAFRGVVHPYLKNGICLLDRQSCLFGRLAGRIRSLGLSIHLEAELTVFRSFALLEKFRRRFFVAGPP